MANQKHNNEWDEPEPLTDHNSELRRSPYGQNQRDFDDKVIIGQLRIDRLVSSISETNATQRKRIASLLEKHRGKSLSIWLSWLSKKDWTGESLLLFLEFWAIWEKSADWWESWHWDSVLRLWMRSGRKHPTCLSKEDAYKLIQLRCNCRPHEVIDRRWFGAWKREAMYERGFPTFASFAVFRAEFGEDWRAYVDWDNPDGFDDTDYDYEEWDW